MAGSKAYFRKRLTQPVFYAWLWVACVSSLSIKRREMHQILARAIIMYIILASKAVEPPAIQATRSNENRPTRPQFIPPIIVRISASLFNTIIYMTAPFHKLLDRFFGQGYSLHK